MSKKVKIYKGMTFSLKTGEVVSHGDIKYVDGSSVDQLKGGPKTSTTTSGFAKEFKPEIKEMLGTAKGLYKGGKLGKVAGLTEDQLLAMEGGKYAAGEQALIEDRMAGMAAQGIDLSGRRTAAAQDARRALGLSNNAAARTGNIGGTRQHLSQNDISNQLASQFAGIDQEAQQQDFNRQGTALAAQGTGARSLAEIGAAQQQQEQNILGGDYKAISEYIGLFSGMAPKSSTSTSTGGGK